MTPPRPSATRVASWARADASPDPRRVAAPPLALAIARITFRSFVYVLYCTEAGVALLVVPWTWIWQENFYFARFPLLRAIGLHPAARGAVSGIGLALLLEGLSGFFRL